MSREQVILDNSSNKIISQYTKLSHGKISSRSEAERENKSCDSGLAEGIKGHIAQEQHHAMHVLFFLQILVYRTLNGERVKRSILGRIIHHLMDLREFLDDGFLNDLANVLCGSVQQEYDSSLSYLFNRIHKGIRFTARVFDHSQKHQFLSAVTNGLIVLSEHEKNPKICMYPWLITNQEKILEFAEHYGKSNVFKDLLPIIKMCGTKGAHDRS